MKPPLHKLFPTAPCSMRLPFFHRPVRAGCCRCDLTLVSVSPHLLHSGKIRRFVP
jgi:hypothetical protein